MRKNNYHMDIETFKKFGYKVIDEIADYYEHIEDYPVNPKINFGDILEKLPTTPPEQGEPFESIIEDVKNIIIPGLTHWQSPNFFAFFPSNTSFPSILGELYSAAFGVQGMIWSTSPACTELEICVMDWIAKLLSLPEKFMFKGTGGGVIEDSASSASLCAIIAAREDKSNLLTNKKGVRLPLIAYVTKHTHSSVIKGLKIAGIGEENIRFINTDIDYAMNASKLDEQINKDISEGLIPFFVCATIGTTSTNAIDPVDLIGNVSKKYNLWLHVDAAMLGTAAICDEYKFLLNGIDKANSFCFNPHKWMFTNFDCDCFFVDDRSKLIKALTIMPEYLKNIKEKEDKEVIDYRDWQVPLGRRFRALKLWFVIRHYGKEGLNYHIKKHIDLAAFFEKLIKDSEHFEIIAKRVANLVCFRHKKGNKFNESLLNEINDTGKIYLSHSKIDDIFFLRFCVGQTYTEKEHVLMAWQIIQNCAN
jgi:aromatic-L-amino-acid decarboxylase